MTATLVLVAAWLTGAAAAIAALGYLGRKARQLWRIGMRTVEHIEALHALAERETRPNGGDSLRDKLDEQCTAIRGLRDDLAQHTEDDRIVQTHIIESLDRLGRPA